MSIYIIVDKSISASHPGKTRHSPLMSELFSVKNIAYVCDTSLNMLVIVNACTLLHYDVLVN